MIEEEYSFEDVKDYLFDNIDLLITGIPTKEERSSFFFNLWTSKKKNILLLDYFYEDEQDFVTCKYYDYSSKPTNHTSYETSLNFHLKEYLSSDEINIGTKKILVDITALNHAVIMVLTNILINYSPPAELFVSYIRPTSYVVNKADLELSNKINQIRCVPTFVKRNNDNQCLCAFIGFEGTRLKNVLESPFTFDSFKPIVAFPSGTPQWYNNTMRNSMYLLNKYDDLWVNQCLSESIFGAYELLCELLNEEKSIIIAPLGTRPHSMAAALYASKHKQVRLLYDFVEEKENRTTGIDYINIYHLSSFITTEGQK